MNFNFSTADEIGQELAQRLKAARLAQGLRQPDLAQRAGVSAGTIKALENKGQSTLGSLIRVVQALGLAQDLQAIFVRPVLSIADMEQAQQPTRQRAPKRNAPKPADGGKAPP